MELTPIGFFFAGGAVIVFLVLPIFLLSSNWKRLEPGARNGLVTVYLILLVASFALWLGFRHWLHSGL